MSHPRRRPRVPFSVFKFTVTRRFLLVAAVVALALGGAVISGYTALKGDSSPAAVREDEARQVPSLQAGDTARPSPARSRGARSLSHLLAEPYGAPSFLVPTVTASKTDALLTDVDSDGKADPGDTLRYTVNIGASGMDAEGVMFSDTIDPNTTLVPNSVQTTPLARNDSYSATGNIRITVSAPGVLSNDADADGVGPALTVSAGATSANGGNVSLSADGSFTYNPPAGFEGTDSFTYTLNDGEGNTDTATVSITVTGMIWFINNNAPSCLTLAAGCGRLSNPFSTLAAFATLNNGAGNNPAANDNIFVYESATDYVGSVTLLNGQKFIGQDATATLSSISGVVPPVGSDPLPATSPGAPIVNITSAGIGITVAQNNILRGFTGGNATTDITGTGFGTLNISDVTLNGTGRALDLTNGNLTGSFGSISSTNSATTGMSLSTVAGSLTTGSTTISNPTGIGISVNTSSATLSFANTAVTGSGGAGVSLTTNTGTITFADLDISPDANQKGLLATDNTVTITATSGTISTSGAAGVEISRASGTTPLALALTSVSTSGGPNGIFLKNTSGSFTVNGDGANTSVGGNATGGTISGMTGADGATSGNGVYLENASNVTLRRMTINGTNQNHGVRGIGVTGFTLEFSTVSGTNGTSTALDEGSVNFDNLLGAAAITSCVIEGGLEDNLNVVNTSGTLNRLTISGSTFGFNNTASGNNNLLIESQNAGTVLNWTLKGSLVKGARADWINAANNSGSTMDAVVGGPLVSDGNTFDNLAPNAHPGAGAGGNRVVFGAVGPQTVDIRNNTMKGSKGEAIRLRGTGTAGGLTGTVNGRVRNNTIGVAATANSGSSEGSGIFIFGDGGSDMNVAITNNSVFQYNNNGISMTFGDELNNGSVFNVTVTGNTVNTPGTINTDFNAIHLNNGTVAATDDFTTCADIGGAGALSNNITNGGKGNVLPNNVDVRLRQRQNTTVLLPGYAGSNTDTAAVETYLRGRNATRDNPFGAAASVQNAVAPATRGFQNGGAGCTQPSVSALLAETSEAVASKAQVEELKSADGGKESILRAVRGENLDQEYTRGLLKLTEAELSAVVHGALARWTDAGLTLEAMQRLQAMTFEIADLPGSQLAAVRGDRILIDETAAGYGWFLDGSPLDDTEFGVAVPGRELQSFELSAAHERMDLLTAVMRQLGHALGKENQPLDTLEGWLMQGALGVGVRRAPALQWPEVGKVATPAGASAESAGTAAAGAAVGQAVAAGVESYAKGDDASARQLASSEISQLLDTGSHRWPEIASMGFPGGLGAKSPKAPAATAARAAAVGMLSGETVSLNIGTLPAGKSVTVTFDVTVDNPFTGATAQVCNQGTVTADGGISVQTDDPDVMGSANPTCTTIDLPDVTVEVQAPGSTLEDGNGTITYTFTRETANASPLTVNFSVDPTSTASAADDYTVTGTGVIFNSGAGTGTVIIPASQTTATVTVEPTDDTTVEPDETVKLNVASGTGYDVGTPGSATGTILNDDTDVSVAVAPASTAEDGAGNLVYTFTRVGVTTGELTVNFNVGGTATFSTDYAQTGAATFAPPNGTVTFAAGSSTATVTVDPTADTTVEDDETVILTVAAGAGYNVAAMNSTATGTITNDDTDVSVAVAPLSVAEDGAGNLVYTFTRVGVTSTPLTVNFSINGTATFSTDYAQTGAATFAPPNGTVTFAAGSSTATVTVDPTADMTSEPDETVILTLAAGMGYNVVNPNSATGTIENDDNAVSVAVAPASVEEDGLVGLVYTFTRTDPTGTLTVNFNVGGSATFGDDYGQSGGSFTPPTGTVMFADGNLTAEVTVTPVDDNLVEGSETVTLTVVAGTGYGVGSPAFATGTITDNDAATLNIEATQTVTEGGGGQTITVTLNAPAGVTLAGQVTADVVDAGGGTAVSGTDYTAFGTQTVTFPMGSGDGATQTVTLTPTDDALVEGDETVNLKLQNVGGTAMLGNTDSVVTIDDNDTATVSFAASSSTAPEGTTPHNVGVTLTINASGTGTPQLAQSVSVNVQDQLDGTATAGGGDYTFTNPQTVTFNSGSGDSTQNVSLAIVNDNSSEGDETVNLALNTLVDGTGGQVALAAPTAHTVTISDNDVDLRVTKMESADPVNSGSGPGNLTYTVTVANVGLTNATGVVVSEDLTLPSGVTVVSITPSQGTFAPPLGPDGTWTVGSLAVGNSATLTVVLTVDATAVTATNSICDTATVTAANETLVNTGDDSATECTSVVQNVPPVANPDSYMTNEDTPLNVAAPGVLGNDTDTPGDTLTAVLVSGPSNALSFALNANGSFSYTPNPNFFGMDSFTYKARDSFGADSEAVTVTITVNAVNDAPTVAVAPGGQCGEDVVGTMNLTLADVEGDGLTLSAVSSNTALVPNANIVFGGAGADRTVTITPVPQKNTENSLVTITVSDGQGGTGTATIMVVVGTDKKDTINPGNGVNMIFGLKGDDTINGGNSIDLICGGDGRDTLKGGNGPDTLDGGAGNDILRGEAGDDMLTGGAGADSFDGGTGNDVATDFNAGQGDTQNGTVEMAALDWAVGEEFLAAHDSEHPWWAIPLLEGWRLASGR